MPGLFDRLQSEIQRREEVVGISPAELLDLSPELRRLVQTITRRGHVTLAELAGAVGMPADEVAPLLAALEEKGFVTASDADGERRYKAQYARRRGREVPLNIWEALTERIELQETTGSVGDAAGGAGDTAGKAGDAAPSDAASDAAQGNAAGRKKSL
jgi:DNA-binding MarR family transcriptional regulator